MIKVNLNVTLTFDTEAAISQRELDHVVGALNDAIAYAKAEGAVTLDDNDTYLLGWDVKPAKMPVVGKTEPVSPMVDMWLLVWGNPMDGLTFEGPFFSHEDATNAAEDSGGDWWVTQIERPAIKQQTKSEIMREVADSLGIKVIEMPLAIADVDMVVGFPKAT